MVDRPRKFRAPVADGVASFLAGWRAGTLAPHMRATPLPKARRGQEFEWVDGAGLLRAKQRRNALVLFVAGGR